jgi:hypothetical protein
LLLDGFFDSTDEADASKIGSEIADDSINAGLYDFCKESEVE